MQLTTSPYGGALPPGPVYVATVRVQAPLPGRPVEHIVSLPDTPPFVPITDPLSLARFTGSLDDAVAGVQKLLTAGTLQSSGDVVALFPHGTNGWRARVVLSDKPGLAAAIDESRSGMLVDLRDAQRGLAALVTAGGVLRAPAH